LNVEQKNILNEVAVMERYLPGDIAENYDRFGQMLSDYNEQDATFSIYLFL